MTQRRGFTLIEIVIVIGIIGILSAIGWEIYPAVKNRMSVSTSRDTATQALRRAYLNAVAVTRDAPWGVRFDPGQVVVFAGPTYATRIAGSEEAYQLPSALAVGGTTEYDFRALSGTPVTAGSTTFTLGSSSTTFTINDLGLVQ